MLTGRHTYILTRAGQLIHRDQYVIRSTLVGTLHAQHECPQPSLTDELDQRFADQIAGHVTIRQRKAAQRSQFLEARDAGKASRHSARENPPK